MPELVEDQRCGMVVPPNDPSALGAAISRLAENEAERIQLGRAARARIETKFSIEKTTDETFDLYRQLLS
jgi:glycosyltransferase involved in cell wall biosynthesis